MGCQRADEQIGNQHVNKTATLAGWTLVSQRDCDWWVCNRQIDGLVSGGMMRRKPLGQLLVGQQSVGCRVSDW